MSTESFNLAIETSGRTGSFALGLSDELIEVVDLPPQLGGAGKGGSSLLMQHLDALCKRRSISPAQLAEVYLSIGPGSFTGLRVGVTLCKMFALTLGTKIVAIPTLDVVACNGPADVQFVAVGLNLKKETLYTGIYERQGDTMKPIAEPELRTMSDLLAIAPRPLAIIGDPLPELPDGSSGVTVMDKSFAQATAQNLWRLGRMAAKQGRYTDPLALVPLYVRPPEAVELWDRIHGKA